MISKKLRRKIDLKASQSLEALCSVAIWIMVVSLAPAVGELDAIPKSAWLTYEALPVYALLGLVGVQFWFVQHVKALSGNNINRLKTMPG